MGFLTNDLEEIVDVVNEQDLVVDVASRKEAHKVGLLHRSVSIFLVNSSGKIFLQKRASTKKSFPSYWDISAAEHVLTKESYKQAAQRGLAEELGIKAKVKKIRNTHFQNNSMMIEKIQLVDKELVQLFVALSDDQVEIDKSEVEEGNFFRFEEIIKMVKTQSELFTPWFLDEWAFISDNSNLLKIA